jgi:hypothetical protein
LQDEGISLGGYTIAKDTIVMVMLPFVNSDPAVYANPTVSAQWMSWRYIFAGCLTWLTMLTTLDYDNAARC